MSLKQKALFVLVLLSISNSTFSQETKKDSSTNQEPKDSYNTWSLGLGLSNLKTYGDLSSFGVGNLDSYTTLGFYIYGDRMFNPIVGLEVKLDYSGLGASGQGFTGNESITGINEAIFGNQVLTMDGSKFGLEVNAIINLNNLWKLNSTKWSWSFLAGVGTNYFTTKLYDETDTNILSYENVSSLYINSSIDLKYRLNKRFDIALRPTVNLNYTDKFDAAVSSKNNYETFLSTHLGLVYKFGKEKRHAIWANNEDIGEEIFQVVDTDEDGVIDEVDKEPETPTDAMVYGSGIAIDSDMDGVPDHIDKCPFLRGIEANEGCPEDRDGDGIYDYDDVCPDVIGVAENLGCPTNNSADDITNRIFLLAKSIYFKTNSDQITSDSYSILNEIANIMLQYPNTQFLIGGHSDNTGTSSYNLYLSKKRASSVQRYLSTKGVKDSRLYAEGYGIEKPTHSNKTSDGRKKNRRVEINYIQPGSEKGLEVYEEGINTTESLTIIQPNVAGNLSDSDGDGVADIFDQESGTPKGALVYGNGIAVDTDKDGLPDYMDECPLEFGSEEKNGCPDASSVITVASGETMSIQDSDGDGVMDVLDVDSETPLGAKVYGNGVAIDTDSDGIIDLYDNCPLKQGTEENEGCPENIEISSTSGQISVADADGDGVIDTLDMEPNTPREARVYGNGVAVDTDRDGIADYLDECPLKYGSIDKNGCPLSEDSDNDGVPNEFDKEPNTPFGVKVYGNGVAMDMDSDGTPDYKDACPLQPGESSKGGCPDVIESTSVSGSSVATPQLKDTDKDGVADRFDAEPNTPFGAKVYGDGVAVDSDNDGIADYKDNCPNVTGTEGLSGCAPEEEKSNISLGAGIAVGGSAKTQTQSINMNDSDKDGVMDTFDKEKNTAKGARVYGNGVAIDTDGDGIPDHKDKCPLVAGTKKLKGCKEAVVVKLPKQIELKDTDKDGVIDQFDKDPNTPAGALVYGNGIPIDSDRDGLPDYKDKCPMKSGPVENEGCPKSVKEFDWADDDGDGVVNEFDREQNTPADARVYGNGVAVDSDYDDIPDHIDECPFEKGSTENKGCPKVEGAIKENNKDTDKDGVIDLYDKEPDTPYGVKVYSNGVSLDSDKDKVPDYKDRCPKSKGLPENEGCPKDKDLDGDGVTDADDLCPDIPGTLENKGCPNKNFDKSVYLRIEALAQKIKFERTKNTLSNETMDNLDGILKIMQEYIATKFEIASHTDNKHNEKYSLFLSKRRANAIMKYLVDGGVNEDRLSSEGYGDSEPKFSNSGDLATSELNNRIEFNFQD
jgi:outer membrane protein OmpA-like peptidoglycan-associated protein